MLSLKIDRFPVFDYGCHVEHSDDRFMDTIVEGFDFYQYFSVGDSNGTRDFGYNYFGAVTAAPTVRHGIKR